MKRLYLIRHAKSSWKNPDQADFDRPLNKRGKTDAPVMGRRLAAVAGRPDLIVASGAKRTRRTAGMIAGELGYDQDGIEVRDDLYLAGLQDMVGVIRETADAVDSLCLVGHNDTISACAEWLTGASIGSIPTCGVVAVDFACASWRGVDRQGGTLVFFDYPKRHAKPGDSE